MVSKGSLAVGCNIVILIALLWIVLYGGPVTNTSITSTEYERVLCQMDRMRLQLLEGIDFHEESLTQLETRFFKFVADPFSTSCREVKRIGGRSLDRFCTSYPDGQKFICMDDILSDMKLGKCLIYSFGIRHDWSFEDTMDSIGCTIYAFDMTVDFPKHRGNSITFEKIGVADLTNETARLYSLTEILARNGHTNTKISYLKFDIEGWEIPGIPAWFASGALDHVQQLGYEFHADTMEEAVQVFKTMRDLILEGGYRLLSHDVNGVSAMCAKNHHLDNNFRLAEVVLKRSDQTDESYCNF